MKVAIIGAGNIATKMARTIAALDETESYAVASRTLDKARAFADKWGVQKAYGSYDDMLADDAVDLVYVALPHSYHHEWTIKALQAGKHVLCEKPLAVNAAQAQEMIALAEAKNLLLAEAMWTRYLPSAQIIKDIIARGDIGEVMTLSANVGDCNCTNDRLTNPALAGGCLLDLTVYALNFVAMIMGTDVKRIVASMIPTATGVDGQNNIMLEYAGGKMASLFATMYTVTDRGGFVYGREGFIQAHDVFNPEKITVCGVTGYKHYVKQEIAVPAQITGFEYEMLACLRAIAAGRTECPEMPHAETLAIMRQADEIRRQFGIVYPFER